MKKSIIILLAGLFLSVLLWLTPPILPFWSSFFFLWVLPGLAWSLIIRSDHLDPFEHLIIGLGLNLVCTPISTLLLTYIPGPLTKASLLLVGTMMISFPALISIVRDSIKKKEESSTPKTADSRNNLALLWDNGWIWIITALVIAAFLRLVNLNYSEFQGDEATVMVRAAQALEGNENIIFQHKKGPAELVIVMAGWRLVGMTNEWMSRLPFAYAGLLGICAIFLIGKRVKNPSVGGLAALLLAINGFFVGFGRIVQYQSLILALGALGFLCFLVYQQKGCKTFSCLGFIFLGMGALAHYDIILIVPAVSYLILNRLWHDRKELNKAVIPLITGGILGLILVGIFYIPFLNSEFFGHTSTYVSERIGGDKLFYNQTRSFFKLSAVYNAAYLVILILLVWLGKTISTWRKLGRLGFCLSILVILSAITALIWPKMWVSDEGSLLWIPVAILLIGACGSPAQSPGERAIWFWLCAPALFYLFFVAVPLTHIYTIFPPLILLAALGLESTARWLRINVKLIYRPVLAVFLLFFCLCLYYTNMVFVDHSPEYIRTWSVNKNPLFWTPYSKIPDEGLFGFPYRVGWKSVGYLIDQGMLQGSYDSNEEQDVTNFYTRRALRLSCAKPDMYFTAANVQDEIQIPIGVMLSDFAPAFNITANGNEKIAVYLPNNKDETTISVESFEKAFDAQTTPERIGSSVSYNVDPQTLPTMIPLGLNFGDLLLQGYYIKSAQVKPGDYIDLTLIWKSVNATDKDYHVFTHVFDGETMVGQLDGQPVCGQYPTSQWKPGQIIKDPYLIRINDNAAPGSTIPLTAGIYDFNTMNRVVISNSDGKSVGDNIFLTDIEIMP